MVTGLRGLASALAFVFLCLAPTAFSREHDANVVVSSTTFRPATLEVKDKFYRDYLSGADEAIRLTYVDRWRYHEIQSAFHQPRANRIHLDIATLTSPGIGPTETDVRSEFARAAFRMRIDAAIRKFMSDDRAKNIRKAQQFVEALRTQNMNVSFSKEPDAAQLRMGYDVLSDVSRLEYVKGTAGMGFYHGTFMASLTGSKPMNEAFTFNSWKNFNNGIPNIYAGYAFGTKSIQGGLTKNLNRSTVAELMAIKPTADNGVPDSVLLRMTYTF